MEFNYSLKRTEIEIEKKYLIFGKKYMGYVEGPDDIPFWKNYLKKHELNKIIELEDVGGTDGVKKYEQLIEKGSEIIVFKDRDYNILLKMENLNTYPNILYTYGHSIENTLCCHYSIIRVLEKTKVKVTKSIEEKITEDIKNLIGDVYELFFYEIAFEAIKYFKKNKPKLLKKREWNELECESIFSSFHKFENKNLKNKIFLEKECPSKLIKLVKRFLKDKNIGANDIRGHFYLEFVVSLLKKISRKKDYNVKNFFAISIEHCLTCDYKKKCKDELYYNDEVNKLKKWTEKKLDNK